MTGFDSIYLGLAFGVLPRIPSRVAFYEADDEFPANTQIMLDKSALRFLEFECLAFLGGIILNLS